MPELRLNPDAPTTRRIPIFPRCQYCDAEMREITITEDYRSTDYGHISIQELIDDNGDECFSDIMEFDTERGDSEGYQYECRHCGRTIPYDTIRRIVHDGLEYTTQRIPQITTFQPNPQRPNPEELLRIFEATYQGGVLTNTGQPGQPQTTPSNIQTPQQHRRFSQQFAGSTQDTECPKCKHMFKNNEELGTEIICPRCTYIWTEKEDQTLPMIETN